jgi:Zn-finger nucleic acid-binding protein
MNDLPATSASPVAGTTGCVHCHAALQERIHESITVLVCPVGHGLFLHADALKAAVHDRTADRPEAEERAAVAAQAAIPVEQLKTDEGQRTCPTCGTLMGKRVFAYESGVPIDVCEQHGVWLDHGELERIEAWSEAQEADLAADVTVWGGASGKLEQIEAESERRAADDVRDIHWGPVGRFMGSASHWWSRRDDR